MSYHIGHFDTKHVILFMMYIKTFVQCLVITPRTIPDNIELFNSNHDHNKSHVLNTVKYNKPWLSYMDTHLKKILSDCLSRMENKYSVKCGNIIPFFTKLSNNLLQNEKFMSRI